VALLNNPDLITRLERCKDLPTPPGVAEQIIGLSTDSNSNISSLAEVVSLDPALTVKVLRMANSPMYARAASVNTLEQAVMMFGWNGMLNLALSFSLVSKIESSSTQGLDYNFFWKRSISAAVTAKHLSKVVGIDSRKEDLFLPGLLQDVGMLALDKAMPDMYAGIINEQHQHKVIQQTEKDLIGVDHALVGAWLLDKWNLPKRIIDLVSISHNEERYADVGDASPAENCIEVSNVIADCICSDEGKKDYQYAAEVCEKILGMDENAFLQNLECITQEITETAEIFELDVGDASLINCIAEQAKELLLLRSMETLKTAEELHHEAENLEIKAQVLEDSVKLDPLTNVYNRGYLESTLESEFHSSTIKKRPLTLIMVDLDNFKNINDSHGHSCGDKVLIFAVEVLRKCIRDTDSLCRYGGEEFVILLPNTSGTGSESLANRIIKQFNSKDFVYKDNINISITASLGVATHGEEIMFDNWEHLLNVADYCMYASKAAGKNKYTLYKEGDTVKAVAS
jgi:diguanylate cyclase (GGDEF)-like protein